MQVYKVLGVMSGTSLDGLDLAYCELIKAENWSYKILSSVTVSYSEKRKKILESAIHLTGEELTWLDRKLGKYIGEECRKFILQHKIQPDLIASHGHTIFHQPQKGFTLQIGNGANIFAETGIPVVCDFRNQDVALGGQGAPLVPIGDQLLFGNFGACLNLGGFANISTQVDNIRTAWDICAVNVVLNHCANKLGKEFDTGGMLAESGKFHELLYQDLQALRFYQESPPKSLGIEWVKNELIHLLEKYLIPVEDILHTYTIHVSNQIGNTIESTGTKEILVTGGGVYNHFLVEAIKKNTSAHIYIPDDATIQYKEALIFGLLGVLKWIKEVNILSSVTGASRDHSSGLIYGG